jgi:hypothetical protein
MTEQVAESAARSDRSFLMPGALGVLALIAGLAGARLMELGTRIGISSGVLLLVVALGLAAVSIGGRPFGPDVEGPLDLSARMGLGLLGGVLGGLLHGGLTALTGSFGLTLLAGVGIDVDLSAAEWLLRALKGSVWGLGLGVFYPILPGRRFIQKGATFSLLPSLYTLLVVYPVFLGFGIFGTGQGLLTFPFVLIGNALAGILAAWVISWGERTDVAPVSAPLVD